jgi:hypothetical protein
MTAQTGVGKFQARKSVALDRSLCCIKRLERCSANGKQP